MFATCDYEKRDGGTPETRSQEACCNNSPCLAGNMHWDFYLFQEVSQELVYIDKVPGPMGAHFCFLQTLTSNIYITSDSPTNHQLYIHTASNLHTYHNPTYASLFRLTKPSSVHQFRTLKYLQYEFFATSAHSISGVLPARMEFRPMVEMTPEHLEAQVPTEWFKCALIFKEV